MIKQKSALNWDRHLLIYFKDHIHFKIIRHYLLALKITRESNDMYSNKLDIQIHDNYPLITGNKKIDCKEQHFEIKEQLKLISKILS